MSSDMKLLRLAGVLPLVLLGSCQSILPPARHDPEGRRPAQSDRVYMERLDREMDDAGR